MVSPCIFSSSTGMIERCPPEKREKHTCWCFRNPQQPPVLDVKTPCKYWVFNYLHLNSWSPDVLNHQQYIPLTQKVGHFWVERWVSELPKNPCCWWDIFDSFFVPCRKFLFPKKIIIQHPKIHPFFMVKPHVVPLLPSDAGLVSVTFPQNVPGSHPSHRSHPSVHGALWPWSPWGE